MDRKSASSNDSMAHFWQHAGLVEIQLGGWYGLQRFGPFGYREIKLFLKWKVKY